MEKFRILIVEDDDIARSFLLDILQHDGYDVDAASNGREGLEALYRRKPDLILSDVIMPEMSGHDLFRKVQEDASFQDVPFIFLTSLDDGETQIDIKALGPDDYLQKPVRPRHLLATVKGKLIRKQRRDEQAERERDRIRDRIRWTLSHELRTPLTVIQGISELLLNDAPISEGTDYQDLLQSLRSQSFQLGQLIENFLLVTRIDSGVEEENWRRGAGPVKIAEAIEEVAFPLWEKARARGAEFLIDAPDNLTPVRVYRPHLIEVLRQVLDNGFKFADPGKPRIEVRAAVVAEGWVRVTIGDNGKGISEREREKLFEKLSQVDREIQEQQGSGLGLYIAKRLMDMNGGEIRIRSESGAGFEVEILLPAAPAAEAPAPTRSPPAATRSA